MEVYIDDMLVKSKERSHHDEHIQEAFELLRAYGMKLNPSNCAIEANPAHLKAILESSAPSSIKGVQHLIGWLAALGWFISRFIDRLKSFFVTL